MNREHELIHNLYDKDEGRRVLVKAKLRAGGHTYLHYIENDALTANRDLDEIVKPTVLPYDTPVGEKFILFHGFFGLSSSCCLRAFWVGKLMPNSKSNYISSYCV